jgi:hypothetical protein
MLGSEIHIN